MPPRHHCTFPVQNDTEIDVRLQKLIFPFNFLALFMSTVSSGPSKLCGRIANIPCSGRLAPRGLIVILCTIKSTYVLVPEEATFYL